MSNELILTTETFKPIETRMQDAGFSPTKVKQEISFALQTINKNPQLQKCTRESFMQAVLNISNIGLSLNPAAKEAYLIPRYNSVTRLMDATLEPGYIGLVKLLTDAGSITSILCQLVYEKDLFEMDLANNLNPVTHKPELTRNKRGAINGVYALATLPDKTRQVEYMCVDEINEIRGRSETYKAFKEGKIKSCTWETDWSEMARKTVIKRIYKYLPRTERMNQIDKAIEEDNRDFSASNDQLSYIDSLLHTSTLEERQRGAIEMEMSVMNADRASEVINMLQGNQQLSDKQQYKKFKVPAA